MTKLIERQFSPLNDSVSSTLNDEMFKILNMPNLQSRFGVAKERWEEKNKTTFRQTDLVNYINQRRKISKATVSLWFNGPTQDISYDYAVLAGEFLGVNSEWLRTGKGPIDSTAHTTYPILSKEPQQALTAEQAIRAYIPSLEDQAKTKKQLLYFFEGLSAAHKETILLMACKLHTIDKPES